MVLYLRTVKTVSKQLNLMRLHRMKYILIILFSNLLLISEAQDSSYFLRLENELTFNFPNKPIVDSIESYSKTYTSIVNNGRIRVEIRLSGSAMLSSKLDDPSTILDAFTRGITQDPNIGGISYQEKFEKRDVKGRYIKFVPQGSTAGQIVQYIILINTKSFNRYNITYISDVGTNPQYSKDDLLSFIQE